MEDVEQQEATEETEALDTEETSSGFRYISSQEELDRVISERLKRERAKFSDYASLKSKAQEYDKIVESSKSETEKLSSKAAEAEAKAQALTAKVRSKSLQFEVASLSTKLGIIDSETALALIGSVEFDENDEPIGVEERLKELVKAKPFLKAHRFEGSADGGSRNASPDLSTVDMDTYMSARNKRIG